MDKGSAPAFGRCKLACSWAGKTLQRGYIYKVPFVAHHMACIVLSRDESFVFCRTCHNHHFVLDVTAVTSTTGAGRPTSVVLFAVAVLAGAEPIVWVVCLCHHGLHAPALCIRDRLLAAAALEADLMPANELL